MNNPRNVRFLTPAETLRGEAKTGISLHCHTLHSKENLDFVPYYAERIPLISYLWRREVERCVRMNGRPPKFDSGYWTPPLTGQQVYQMETASMDSLGLDGIVSITDHDSIDANLEIRKVYDEEKVPISMEWTVPFDEAFFHVGVHNLPAARAGEITEQLLDYTRGGVADDARLHELFAILNDCGDVLIVLNHPVWDIEMIGQRRHERLLDRFLASFAKWIHAIEVNGFRTWKENKVAIEIAEQLGMPIISGGDRHCLHSNTMINVSNASTFDEFVNEVRIDGFSQIAVMPEYKRPLPARQVASIAQILGNFQDFPEGRRLWSDRVYLDADDGLGLKTLTEHWNGHHPVWSRAVLALLAGLSHPVVRPLIGMTIGDTDIGRDDRHDERGLVMSGVPITAGGLSAE